MIKRGLTLVAAMHITASVFINDDAGLWAGCTTAPERTPVPDVGTGCRRAPEAECSYQLRVMRRDVVVAVTNGRLDFGPWEQSFQGQLGWLARES